MEVLEGVEKREREHVLKGKKEEKLRVDYSFSGERLLRVFAVTATTLPEW